MSVIRCLLLNDLKSPVSGEDVPWCTRVRMRYNGWRAKWVSPWWDWKIVIPLKWKLRRIWAARNVH